MSMIHLLQRWAAALAVGVILFPVASFAAAPTITSFSPTSGPIGTTVVVKGTNLTTPTAVKFDGTTAKFTGSTSTQLTATVPATGAGTIAISTAGGTATSSAVFTVTPGVALTPTSGHPSLAVAMTGGGFGPYTAVDVYFDTVDTALATSNGKGVVSITVQVPKTSQPGTHWMTMVERANDYAAQAAFTVNTNWVMQGFSAANSGFNTFENTLTTDNVNQLGPQWKANISNYGNPAPILELNGNVYVINEEGLISTFSNTGTLLWTAKLPTFYYEQPAFTTSAGLMIFGNGSSVYAFKYNCRSDGGVCSPTWVTSLGTVTVTAGLTLFKGIVYVPGSDGSIHPLTPATGALGTSFYATDNTLGAVTTPIVFDLDGSYYYATGGTLQGYKSSGYYFTSTYASGVYISPITISGAAAFYTTSDGMVHSTFGWSQPTSSGGCNVAPVVANNLVFAGGCSSLSAFEASTGAPQWNLTGNNLDVTGLSFANGILYACEIDYVGAYDRYGDLLWTGGECNTAPVIANGTVLGSDAILAAYTLPGLSSNVVSPRPKAAELKPDLRLVPRQTLERIE